MSDRRARRSDLSGPRADVSGHRAHWSGLSGPRSDVSGRRDHRSEWWRDGDDFNSVMNHVIIDSSSLFVCEGLAPPPTAFKLSLEVVLPYILMSWSMCCYFEVSLSGSSRQSTRPSLRSHIYLVMSHDPTLERLVHIVIQYPVMSLTVFSRGSRCYHLQGWSVTFTIHILFVKMFSDDRCHHWFSDDRWHGDIADSSTSLSHTHLCLNYGSLTIGRGIMNCIYRPCLWI